jgi:hypothetical protein
VAREEPHGVAALHERADDSLADDAGTTGDEDSHADRSLRLDASESAGWVPGWDHARGGG